ncbi:hypothetical protein [Acidipropionibacterium jensenii]|uniref:Uncharacterized protein n=1 Tax=Acidipropionibacterium jensenii TaxID=1749 RepID=A0A3S4YWH2_9ACTN|nr:hypothetical protein [Acidipropionibacterium jensenii]MDN5976561.1 hypothetical protein [Acidipropionibacterium jensenii]MDN5995453.1 hypothetical protein [Acidipropionibacterium jensenii]MDN6425976.1 hypothetical protein [Acidipropionibacterium jensenii]MDN6440891.1 hypothetical protein [Acidipropionibacterium jensenii]MDN6479557.1 hypothetical protein [Acidipropionibacterium jensenii]
MTALLPPAHPDLACEIVQVPHGVRLLCPDGRSFLLRGTTVEKLVEGRLPDAILQTMATLGLVVDRTPITVAVVGSGSLAAAVREAVQSVCGALVVELGEGTGRRSSSGHWSILADPGSRLSPGLTVVCPQDPLGLREPVQLCQDRGIPVVVGWAGTSGAWLGPVALPTRPGCQDCLDTGMARRDPLWAHTAAALAGSSSAWGPRQWVAQQISRLVDQGSRGADWITPSWSSWTSEHHHTAILDPLPDCPRCRPHRHSPAPRAA